MSSYTFPGPPNWFLGPPDKFPGYIGPLPGLLLMEILLFYPRLVQQSGGHPDTGPIEFSKNPKGQVSRTNRLGRATLGVSLMLGHSEHFIPFLQILVHIPVP